MKAIAPRAPLDTRWDWLRERVAPNIAVLTEAQVPTPGPPNGWSACWRLGGLGPKRRWGTVIAGHGCDLVEVTEVQRTMRRPTPLASTWPGSVVACDVFTGARRWGTVIGIYGITMTAPDGERCGHGRHSVPRLLDDLAPLVEDRSRRDRLVVAGDLNIGANEALIDDLFTDRGLVDLIDETADHRAPLDGCAYCDTPERSERCGHLWTHKNGTSPRAARQQIDFIFATESLVFDLIEVSGGAQSYPDAFDLSDHAPVVADFRP